MLAEEYLKTHGKEIESCLGKRDEFERIFSSKAWEIEQ